MTSFRKTRRPAPPGFFRVEAAGLRWLADAQAVAVVGVLTVGNDHLELERLHPSPPTAAHAAQFGRQLARLHDAGAASFGCPPPGWEGPGYIGDAALPFGASATWGAFYAALRVRPYLAALTPAQRDLAERLCTHLEAGAFDDPAPPARLHGDLWSGNLVYTADGVVLIDPAAHGGHRITDLAMLALFGAPHLATVFDAYEAASPQLPPDWRALITLHQVHPLLVHATLFSGGYAVQATRAVEQALTLIS